MNALEIIFGARPKLHHGRRIIDRPPEKVHWFRARVRGDAAPVRAWLAESDHTISTGKGKLKARGGRDVIVEHAPDDHAVVRKDIFDRVYEALGGGRFRKRRDVVYRYFTLDRPAAIKTMEGYRDAEPGDWVMQGVEGELWPIERAKAVQKYEQV